MDEIFEKDFYSLFDKLEDEEEFLEVVEDSISNFRRVSIESIVDFEIEDYTPCLSSYLWNKTQEVRHTVSDVIKDGSTFNMKTIEEVLKCGLERFYSNLLYENFEKIIWNVAKEYFEKQYYENNLNISEEEDIETPLREMLEQVGMHTKSNEIMYIVDAYIDILKRGLI